MEYRNFDSKRISKFSGLVLAAAFVAAAVLPACKSSTAQSNKKGPVDQSANSSQPTAANTPQKTYELPAEIINAEMKTLDGKKITLADYRGKVVLLNVWATWCGPCRMEIPELIKISDEMKERGVEVIGLTKVDDRGNTEERVKDYAETQKISYDIVWASDNVAEEFSEMADYSIPATFLINREGHLVKIFRGFNRARTPQSVRQAVELALNPNATAADISAPPTDAPPQINNNKDQADKSAQQDLKKN